MQWSHITGKRRGGTTWDQNSWPWIQPRVGVSHSRSHPELFVTSVRLLLAKQADFTESRRSSVSLIALCAVDQNHQQVSCLPKYAGESVHKAAGSRDNEAFVKFRGASRCALVYSFPLIFIWPLGWRLFFPIFPWLISFEEIIFKLWHRLTRRTRWYDIQSESGPRLSGRCRWKRLTSQSLKTKLFACRRLVQEEPKLSIFIPADHPENIVDLRGRHNVGMRRHTLWQMCTPTQIIWRKETCRYFKKIKINKQKNPNLAREKEIHSKQ